VLRRRREAYHERLADAGPAGGGEAQVAAPASIHDAVRVKEAGLAAHLIYDGYERRSALVRFLPVDQTATEWRAGGGDDLGDFVAGVHRLVDLGPGRATVVRDGWVVDERGGTPRPVRVEKRVALGGGRLDPALQVQVSILNASEQPLRTRLGVEWATTMLGGGGNPAAWWDVARERARHDGPGSATDVGHLAQGNDWLGLEIATTVTPAADAWWAPIETVSNSEAGFERVYQGSSLLLSWPIELGPDERWTGTIDHRATIARDRGLEGTEGADAGWPAPGRAATRTPGRDIAGDAETPSARGLRATG
jgi:alpha-amylase